PFRDRRDDRTAAVPPASEVIMYNMPGDDKLLVLFTNLAIKNEAKSVAEGRPIYDDTEQCQIRIPGNRSTQPYFPAHAVSHWHTDPYTGGQRQVTYAERFDHEYRQFKEHATQTKTGTPLTEMPTLSEGRRAELRALNIYTVEQLAGVDGQELKNL